MTGQDGCRARATLGGFFNVGMYTAVRGEGEILIGWVEDLVALRVVCVQRGTQERLKLRDAFALVVNALGPDAMDD